MSNVYLYTVFLFCVCHTALRIHISQCTADILVQAGSFELEERGEIEMKVTKEPDFFPVS